MKNKDLKIEQRKSVSMNFNDAWHKEGDFIEVTEWSNEEGWDIQINDTNHFSFHFTEFKALKKLINFLEKS
jgi:hypothetical protein